MQSEPHGPVVGNSSATKEDVNEIFEGEAGNEIWSLLMLAARLPDANTQAAASAEPAVLAKFTFSLAKAFNLFYHHHRIIAEENLAKRAVLIAVADFTRRQLTAALDTLGIAVPAQM
jgi:arginyl-tRNA synthetase